MCLDHQFDKLEGATQQGVPFDIEPSPQPMLLRALLAVPCGEAVYGAPVARRIVAFTGAHQQYAAQVVPELTEREREVLELVAASLGNQRSPVGWKQRRITKTVGSPHPCGNHGSTPLGRTLVSMALSRRSLIKEALIVLIACRQEICAPLSTTGEN